ncbi:MAG: DMT family transporter [Candidatus Azosocius agrarius]|nr:MAG: DMT family transporter [Gammaproteobacteria bacterium]
MYLIILLFALFASIFTMQKETLKYAEPLFLIGTRMIFSGILLILYEIINKKLIRIKLKHISLFITLSLLNIYLTNMLEIWGMSYITSSKTCLIYSLSPFIAALFSFFLMKEKLSIKKKLGLIIGFIGLAPIIYTQNIEEINVGKIFLLTIPEISIIGAIICNILGWIILKKIIINNYSQIIANGYSMFFGGLLILIHSYIHKEFWIILPIYNFKTLIIYSILTSIISNIICYNLFGYLLKKYTVTFMSFAGLITPIFASIFGIIFHKEIITWHFYASNILFAIGLIIYHREEKK